MSIYQINLAILAALSLFIKAEATAQPTQDRMESNVMINEQNMKLPPLTAADLIQNIKHSAENDLFLEDTFFIKENLIMFSNGRSVENLGDDKDYFTVKGVNVEGVDESINFIREVNAEKKATRLVLYFNKPFINVDYLTKIFGPAQKIEDPYKNIYPSHPAILLPKTHQYGNVEVHHLLIGKKSKTKIISLVVGDGSISKINIKQIEE